MSIRTNNTINKIILHHTGDTHIVTGEGHNKDALTIYNYGSPYDILINKDGSIDLSAQWIYASVGTQYIKNVTFNKTVVSELHHLSQLNPALIEQTQYLHIALIGNFDEDNPTYIQIAILLKLLGYLCKYFKICPVNSLYYYNEFHITSSPGIFFPEKETLLKELRKINSIVSLCESNDIQDIPPVENSLDTPILISPEYSSSHELSGLLATWYPVNNASYYELQISHTDTFDVLDYDNILITSTYQLLESYLDADSTYFWRVRARNSSFTSDWSDIWTFTILSNAYDPITDARLMSGYLMNFDNAVEKGSLNSAALSQWLDAKTYSITSKVLQAPSDFLSQTLNGYDVANVTGSNYFLRNYGVDIFDGTFDNFTIFFGFKRLSLITTDTFLWYRRNGIFTNEAWLIFRTATGCKIEANMGDGSGGTGNNIIAQTSNNYNDMNPHILCATFNQDTKSVHLYTDTGEHVSAINNSFVKASLQQGTFNDFFLGNWFYIDRSFNPGLFGDLFIYKDVLDIATINKLFEFEAARLGISYVPF